MMIAELYNLFTRTSESIQKTKRPNSVVQNWDVVENLHVPLNSD